MRGLGMFFGSQKRNSNYLLEDPRPLPVYADEVRTGKPFADGFTLLSGADEERMGDPPSVAGTKGRCFRGPDNSFEQ